MCALLGHRPKDMDIECPEKRSRDRGRCLDVCMLVSILVLFAALTALAVACIPVLMELRSTVDSRLPPFQSAPEELRGLASSPAYKVHFGFFLKPDISLKCYILFCTIYDVLCHCCLSVDRCRTLRSWRQPQVSPFIILGEMCLETIHPFSPARILIRV